MDILNNLKICCNVSECQLDDNEPVIVDSHIPEYKPKKNKTVVTKEAEKNENENNINGNGRNESEDEEYNGFQEPKRRGRKVVMREPNFRKKMNETDNIIEKLG